MPIETRAAHLEGPSGPSHDPRCPCPDCELERPHNYCASRGFYKTRADRPIPDVVHLDRIRWEEERREETTT